MKKYTKPEILFESFTMSSNIAAGCEEITPLPSQEASCGYPIRGGVVFMSGPECTTCPPAETPFEYNGFCYHIPTETNNLFNS